MQQIYAMEIPRLKRATEWLEQLTARVVAQEERAVGEAVQLALVHLGAFGGCSGSGVYYRGRLIGVVCAGIAGEYSFVALIPPVR